DTAPVDQQSGTPRPKALNETAARTVESQAGQTHDFSGALNSQNLVDRRENLRSPHHSRANDEPARCQSFLSLSQVDLANTKLLRMRTISPAVSRSQLKPECSSYHVHHTLRSDTYGATPADFAVESSLSPEELPVAISDDLWRSNMRRESMHTASGVQRSYQSTANPGVTESTASIPESRTTTLPETGTPAISPR
ncbi:hypothetical protein PoMZ_09118, partial [Pyricularia oryzae]